MMAPSDPVAVFCQLIREGCPPRRADRAAMGCIPSTAFQYCEALTRASALGWYVFLPRAVEFLFDGRTTLYWFEGMSGWETLTQVPHPDCATDFDARAPEALRGFAPPFIAESHSPGIVQLWTGSFVRTRADWSCLIRPPANIPQHRAFDSFEGLIDTDRWYGPVFINIKLQAREHPIRISAEQPIAQICPIPRALLAAAGQGEAHLEQPEDVPADAWSLFEQNLVDPNRGEAARLPGRYAVAARKRDRVAAGCPMHSGA
ncbi:MAG: DUF6065 family protein [Burkholderiales bacterium]